MTGSPRARSHSLRCMLCIYICAVPHVTSYSSLLMVPIRRHTLIFPTLVEWRRRQRELFTKRNVACTLYMLRWKKKNEKCLLQSNLKSLKRLRAHTITTHQSINNFLLNTNEYDMQQYTFNFFSSPFYSSSGSILFVSSARVLGMWKLQFFSAFPLAPNFLLRAHTLCVASANTSAFPSFLRERSF